MKFTALLATAAIAAAPNAFAECSSSKASYQQVSTPVTYEAVLTMHHEETADIVDTAVEAGAFTTLLAAADAAGLVEALKGEGPLTVFAPTDDAFAALPDGTVASLLEPENKDALAGILMLHVISGKVVSGDLAGKTIEAETLNGTLSIDGTDGVTVTAAGSAASVVTADVMASNGVIHVIDTVLLPAS